MRDLPIAARAYILLLSLLVCPIIILALRLSLSSPLDLVPIFLFAALICLAELSPTVIQPGAVEVTVSGVVTTAAVFLFPWHVAFLSKLLGTLIAEMRSNRAWYKRLFNADLALTYAALGSSFHFLFGDFQSMTSFPETVGGILYVALGYTVLNTAPVSLAVALSQRLSPFYVWRTNLESMMGQLVAMPALGLVFAILWSFKPWAAALMVLPLWVLGRSFRLIVDLRQQTERALLAFADAIDARDPLTYHHSQRTAENAVKIACQMGLPQSEIDVIHLSARLHDLGKIGITDQWLRKEGPLSPEETANFREHATLGAQLVNHFSLFNTGEELIRGVHERYDGQGYPDGKRGEEIPLGARIIAVADAYDAMISRRPYRPPLSKEEAIRNLRQGAGTQFDPRVVGAALQVFSNGMTSGLVSTTQQEAVDADCPSPGDSPRDAPPTDRGPGQSDGVKRVLAH